MARNYKRDQKGRFSSGGGMGGGGKMGKSAKNEKARAKYKAAAGKARAAEKDFGKGAKSVASSGPGAKKYAARQVAGAKSGLTRVTQNLRGGAKGNVGRTKRDEARSAGQRYAKGLGDARRKVSAAKTKKAAPQKTKARTTKKAAKG